MLELSNTLSGKKEKFIPIADKKVGMYNCGPTVYDYAHIGNLRKYIFDDILRRVLEFNGYKVTQVINITDFGHLSSDADEGEDKMTKGLLREGKPLTLEAMKELGDFYAEKFKENLKDLNIEMPEVMPKASEHIKEDIELIKTLEAKGFIYKTSDGLYFETSKVKDYGKLGGINSQEDSQKNTENKSESRIGLNTEKKNSRDFAVWKFNPNLGFESPWGKGFPGWHIECSAMSMKYLGETFDIHTGGIDHIAIHHNNEIAQSESATGKKFVNYWLHENFLNIDNTKISKSLKNTFTLQDLKDKDISPLAYRYWILTAHYKSPVNFSWEAIQAAQNTYNNLLNHVLEFSTENAESSNVGEINKEYLEKFKEYINDDLNTAKALGLLWELIKDRNISSQDKKSTLLEFDKVLGLNLESASQSSHKTLEIPKEVQDLIDSREEARKMKDWKKSDTLRKEIEKKGFGMKDTEKGPVIIKM